MLHITVTFTVEDHHVEYSGSNHSDSLHNYKKRLYSELERIQPNSECGLVLENIQIHDR